MANQTNEELRNTKNRSDHQHTQKGDRNPNKKPRENPTSENTPEENSTKQPLDENENDPSPNEMDQDTNERMRRAQDAMAIGISLQHLARAYERKSVDNDQEDQPYGIQDGEYTDEEPDISEFYTYSYKGGTL